MKNTININGKLYAQSQVDGKIVLTEINCLSCVFYLPQKLYCDKNVFRSGQARGFFCSHYK